MHDAADRCRVFRQLHQSGCFVIPNPWDVGSARLLAQLGFPALATTSSGFAWSLGEPDNRVSLEEALATFAPSPTASTVPVNADFEGGFATERRPPSAPTSRPRRPPASPDSRSRIPRAMRRTRSSTSRSRSSAFEAARRAIDDSGTGVLLTGRSEGFIVGRPDLAETIRRLTAYAEAGADCLYAPGIRATADIVAVVNAVAPNPVNVLVGSDFATVAELADMGVRRISVGGALARAAWTGFLQAAREIAGHGTFTNLARAVPFAEVNGLMASESQV